MNSSALRYDKSHSFLVSVALLGVLILGWLAYQPAIPGFFMLDDFDNLGVMKAGVTDTASLRDYLADGKAGPLGRPISKLSFLLDDNAWPSEPGPFKRTNLLIHLLIGVLIFAVSRMVLRPFVAMPPSDWIALTVTAIWLLHPFQISTVMYIVQRMTQLSSLFVIAGVAIHLSLRLLDDLSRKHIAWMTLSLGLFTFLAVFSKESGILLPIYLLVAELTILAHLTVTRQFIWWRRIFILLPSAAVVGYLLYLPRWLRSYATRDFSMVERLITEPVVLVDYLTTFLSMRTSGLGLFHDDFPIYSSLLQPVPLACFALLLIATGTAIAYRKRWPLFGFGVLWFLGGHILEGTTISLELYFEHRNYLPMFGPVLAVVTGLHHALVKFSQEDLHRVPPFLAIIVVAIAGLTTWGHANEWGDRLRLLPIWASEHPDSPRAQRTYAHILAGAGETSGALDTLDYAYERFPHDLSIPLMSIDISCRFDLPLRYDLDELITRVPEHRWTDALRPVLQSLFQSMPDNSCSVWTGSLHALVPALFNIQEDQLWHRAIAGIYVLSGDLYLKEQNASSALTAYMIVDKMQPSPSSALRISGFYMLLEDYDEARKFLALAQSREQEKLPWYRSGRIQEFSEKFELIDQLQAEQDRQADRE